jgi:ferritin-like metal-binding protein YciE
MLAGEDLSRSRTLTAEDRARLRLRDEHQIEDPPNKTVGAASDLKSNAEALRDQMKSLIERLERILESGVKDAGAAIGAAQPVESLPNRPIMGAGRASAERLGEQDIANLVQEALEEDVPDRKLSQIVAGLGLLMASLDSSPRK